MNVVMRITFVVTVGINIFSQKTGSEVYLVTMLNSLQMIIHLPMLHIYVPPNLNVFFAYLLPFAKFDILEPLNDYGLSPWLLLDYGSTRNESSSQDRKLQEMSIIPNAV